MNQSIESKQSSLGHSLLADLRICFPTLDIKYYLEDLQGKDTGEIDKALVIFATTLVRDWDPVFVGQWLAPVHVDEAYQATPDQKAFLQACQRLIDGVRPLLLQGFEGEGPIIDQLYPGAPTETIERAKLVRRALRSTSQFKEWTRYRDQTPAEQFLEVLSTIRIQISNDSTKDVQERQKQTVLYGEWYRDQLRLKELSRHFYQYIRSEKITENLRGIWAALKPIKDINLKLLREKKKEFEQIREDIPGFHYDHRKYNISELPLTFPSVHFAGLEAERTITNEVGKYFWEEIYYLLYARGEWAWRAYNTLSIILGEDESPFSTLSEEDMPPKPREQQGLSEERICTWKATAADFTELFEALTEVQAIECENKDVGAASLASFLGLSLDRYYVILGSVKTRKQKSRTALLDSMQNALNKKFDEDDEFKKKINRL